MIVIYDKNKEELFMVKSKSFKIFLTTLLLGSVCIIGAGIPTKADNNFNKTKVEIDNSTNEVVNVEKLTNHKSATIIINTDTGEIIEMN